MKLKEFFKRDKIVVEDEVVFSGKIAKVVACQKTDENIAKTENGPKYSINQRIKSMMQHYERIYGRPPHYVASLKIKEAAYNEQVWQ
jgi:hypothetical protein